MGSSNKEATVSLRIFSRGLSVSEITEVLGVTPSDSVEKGELVSKRSRKKRYREESLWSIESGLPESAPFEDHLEKITEFTEAHMSSIQSLVPRCDISIYCSYAFFNGQGGIVLQSEILQKLSPLPLSIWINLFAWDDEKQE